MFEWLAARKCRKEAEAGDPGAQCRLGFMYDTGRGVEQNFAEAVKWYRKSADQGIAEAQNNLGKMYEQGLGVAQDYAEAARWYRLAAEQGLAEAQYSLGFIYKYTPKGLAWNRVIPRRGSGIERLRRRVMRRPR